MARNVLATTNAPGAIGPYVQGVQVGDLAFVSGQLGIDPASGEMGKDVSEQAHFSMKNMGAILKEAGMDYSNVVKTTIFLQSLEDFATVNAIYESYFGGQFPSRSCVEVAGLPKGGLVEIECIASK